MYTDHENQSVYNIVRDYEGAALAARLKAGQCPECEGKLTGVRPVDKRWHWRHVARPGHCDRANSENESEWHRSVKAALHDHGYILEYRLGDWRFDAFSDQHEFIVVEVVNSISDRYYDKLDAIAALGKRALWIINMDATPRVACLDFARAVKKAGQSLWWILDRKCMGHWYVYDGEQHVVTDPMAAAVTAAVSGANASEILDDLRTTAAKEAAERLKVESAKAAERNRKGRIPYQKSIDWHHERSRFSTRRLTEFYLWMKLKVGNETRDGMPELPPKLDPIEQSEWLEYECLKSASRYSLTQFFRDKLSELRKKHADF